MCSWLTRTPLNLWSDSTENKPGLLTAAKGICTSQKAHRPPLPCLTGILEVWGFLPARSIFFVQRSLVSSVTFKSHFLIKPFVILVHFCKISFIEKWKVQWHFQLKICLSFSLFFPSLSQLLKEHFIESRMQVHLFLHLIPTWSYDLQFVTSHLLPYPPAVHPEQMMASLGSK